jgi:hypothetical protein
MIAAPHSAAGNNMRIQWWLIGVFVAFGTPALAQEIDLEKFVRTERMALVECVYDVLIVLKKHQLIRDRYHVFETACAAEAEQVKDEATHQLKDELLKRTVPGFLVYNIFQKASELNLRERLPACSGNGCSLEEYRTCLIREMFSALKFRAKPIEFERRAKDQCQVLEGGARSALVGDFDNALRRHLARAVNHQMHEVIRQVIATIRKDVVVLYGEDLVKVQPGRRSCKAEMCGARECISLEEKPTEYECVIRQK